METPSAVFPEGTFPTLNAEDQGLLFKGVNRNHNKGVNCANSTLKRSQAEGFKVA